MYGVGRRVRGWEARSDAMLMMGRAGHVTEEEVAALRHQYGLDLPLHRQYVRFVSGAVRGDLGLSHKHQKPVAQVIATHLPATAELTLCSLCFALMFAIPVGVWCAVKRGSTWDWMAIGGSLVGVSMPGFWLGLVLMLVFAMGLKLLPIAGRSSMRLCSRRRPEETEVNGEPFTAWRHANIVGSPTLERPGRAENPRAVRAQEGRTAPAHPHPAP